MQGEDDLKGLAKIMGFMRAVSIILVLMHFYWFCYSFFLEHGFILNILNRILSNFQKTAGLFSNPLFTKVFSLTLLSLSCLGTKGVKNEKITWIKISTTMVAGLLLFFFNYTLLNSHVRYSIHFYILTTSVGYVCLMVSGIWISRLLRTNLMKDVFNHENESFMLEKTVKLTT